MFTNIYTKLAAIKAGLMQNLLPAILDLNPLNNDDELKLLKGTKLKLNLSISILGIHIIIIMTSKTLSHIWTCVFCETKAKDSLSLEMQHLAGDNVLFFDEHKERVLLVHM